MAQLIKFVQGHQRIKENLLHLSNTLNLASSYIFDGAQGIGKKKLVFAWLQILFCENNSKPCGLCTSCLKIESGNHASVLVIQTEDLIIKTEVADRILNFLSLKSLSTLRFVIIDEAEKMNSTVSNKLLKSVEEPSIGTHFIFITSSYDKLLFTIRSRSQRVRFQNLSEVNLKKIYPTASDWSLKNALGSTIFFSDQQSLNGFFDESFKLAIEALWNPSLTLSEDFKSWFKVLENSEQFIEQIRRWCYHQLNAKLVISQFSTEPSPEDKIEKYCYEKFESLEPHQLSKLFFMAQDWKKQLEQRLDPLLTAEKFFFYWHEYSQQA